MGMEIQELENLRKQSKTRKFNSVIEMAYCDCESGLRTTERNWIATMEDNSLQDVNDNREQEVPTIDGIRQRIGKLKNGKAPCSDNIMTELPKQIGETSINALQNVSKASGNNEKYQMNGSRK